MTSIAPTVIDGQLAVTAESVTASSVRVPSYSARAPCRPQAANASGCVPNLLIE
jgi:hypothetical protein